MVSKVSRRVIVLFMLLAIVVVSSIVISSLNMLLIPLTIEERVIVDYFIKYSYNPYNLSTSTPAIVNAIVWIFRGLDTVYETIVFYTSIVVSLSIYYEYLTEASRDRHRLSLIPRTVARVSLVAALTVGVILAINGYLSPGGGFQGGAIVSALIFTLAILYSTSYVLSYKVNYRQLIILRSIGLLGILSIMTYLVVHTIIAKPILRPSTIYLQWLVVNGHPIPIAIILYNIFELATVASGFAILYLVIIVAGYRVSSS